MENLTKSCKILFNKKILEDYSSKYIFYKNVDELNVLEQKFRSDLSIALHVDCVNEHDTEEDDDDEDDDDEEVIVSLARRLYPHNAQRLFEDKIKKLLLELTKESNMMFVENMLEMCMNIIKSSLDNYADYTNGFDQTFMDIPKYNRIYKKKIEYILNNVLFGCERDEWCEYNKTLGLIYKNARFTCIGCGIHYRILPEDEFPEDEAFWPYDDNYCNNCYDNLD